MIFLCSCSNSGVALVCFANGRLCLFCHKRILEDNGRCPGCWKPYDQPDTKNVPLKDKSCYLAVDDPSNIVAKGTIVNHSVSDENIEVTVDTSVQAKTLIPNPISEDFVETVKDVVGYILSWPSHLVIPCSCLNKIMAKKKKKKVADQDKEKRRKKEKKQRKEEQRKEEEEEEEEERKKKKKKEKKKKKKESWAVVSTRNKKRRSGKENPTTKKKQRCQKQCPCQPGSIECRNFTLKFMKEVVKHGVRPLENDTIGGDINEYTDADIDDIREEWAI